MDNEAASGPMADSKNHNDKEIDHDEKRNQESNNKGSVGRLYVPGNFFRGGGIFGRELTLEARAAQVPSVDNLSVAASETGVSASCGFTGHESDEYSMGLYLNAVGDGGFVSEAAFKNVLPTADGAGSECTQGKEVEPGLYKATVIVERNDGGSSAVVSFVDSPLYRVVKDGGIYVVTPDGIVPDDVSREPEGVKGKEGGEAYGGESLEDFCREIREQAGCEHSLAYEIIQEADTGQDAVLAGQCIVCGEVASYSYVANTAYAAFLKDTIETILSTGEGEAVIESGRWVSFNQAVFDAISQHPETAVTVKYRYEGAGYTVTIPAGADVAGLCGDSGFCGFRYLDQIFGGWEIAG